MAGHRVVAGSQCALETLESEDLAFKQRGTTDPALRIPMGTVVQSREQLSVPDKSGTEQFVVTLEDETVASAVELDDEQRIGLAVVTDGANERPEIGYWLLPAVHGQGLGTEAVTLLLEYVFGTYDRPTVGAQVFAGNEPSRGLLESLGFEQEGRRRNFAFVDGAYRDLCSYGLDRSVWASDA